MSSDQLILTQGSLHSQIYNGSFLRRLPWWLSGKESARNAGDLGSSPDREDPLEKEMATHSSVLVWRTSWTE